MISVDGEAMQWGVVISVRLSESALVEKLNGAIDVSIRLAQAKPVAPSAPAAGGGGFKNPYTGNAEAIAAGRSEFNNHCSHCHAPNAMSPEQSRDLRRQRIRYGDKAMEVTHATITNGRHDRGMPASKEIIGPDHILKVMAFLETVQRAP